MRLLRVNVRELITNRAVLIGSAVILVLAAAALLLWRTSQLAQFAIPGEYGRVAPSSSTEPVEIDWYERKSAARLHMQIPRTYFSHKASPLASDEANYRQNGIVPGNVASFGLRLSMTDLLEPIVIHASHSSRAPIGWGASIPVSMLANRTCASSVFVDRTRAYLLDELRKRRLYVAGTEHGFDIYRTMWCGKDAERLTIEARSFAGVPEGCGDVNLEEHRISGLRSQVPAYLFCSPAPGENSGCTVHDEFRGWQMSFTIKKLDLDRFAEIRRLVMQFLERYTESDSTLEPRECLPPVRASAIGRASAPKR